MDLLEAMKLWEDMGNEIISWDRKDGYHCLFVENGAVVGFTKAVPGGMYWEWPDSLLQAKKTTCPL